MTNIDDVDVEELSAAQIYAESRRYDFGEGYGDRWEYREATECYKCGTMVTGFGHVDCPKCDETVLLEGPMMNYIYPLQAEWMEDFDEMASAEKVMDLPVCLVYMNEEGLWDLALTGGGMDLSWEICQAYVTLGFLPPRHFCALPHMAGRGKSPRDKTILRACRRTMEVVRDHASHEIVNLDRMLRDES